jgi:hypothetical protein
VERHSLEWKGLDMYYVLNIGQDLEKHDRRMILV